MKMYQPSDFILLILTAMTSQCLAFSVRRHHSDSKVVSVIQSSPNLDQADTATEEADATATDACRTPSWGELYEMLHGQTMSGSGSERSEIQHSYLNNTCPASLLERNQKPVESRALCPFVMETDTDVERYPQDILSARCACPHCINPNINGFIRKPGADCMPVIHEMETLRRGQCVDGVYRYEKQTTKVPVACVCARRREV